MDDRPGWIMLLYKRFNAEYPLHNAFLLNSTNEHIAEEADAQPDGREQLRRVALSELESRDPRVVAWSLMCLGVVGQPEDLSAAVRFVADASDIIRRAARVCTFELGRDNDKQSVIISGD